MSASTEFAARGARSSDATPIIECRDLHKWYSGVHALRDINLRIAQGEVVGLVGDNGGGSPR